MNEEKKNAIITEGDVSSLQAAPPPKTPYCVFKRGADILLSFCALVILLLPLLLCMLLLWIDESGPVIFVQKRVGRNGKLFSLYKLCTMRQTDEGERITRIGRVFRRFSVDELLQLVNVLKGDMSLIGPRPLIPEEGDIHHMRHRFGVYALRPGLTGLAQISGRDRLNAAEKLRYDVRYLQTIGLKTDLVILCKTVRKVFRCEDVAERETVN